MIPTTLVVGTPALREQAIADAVEPGVHTAVILEGMPGPHAMLNGDGMLQVARIAAGCPCCEGNLVLRVTLNRMLRYRPRRLFIGLAAPDHLPSMRAFLSRSPYDALLHLTADILR